MGRAYTGSGVEEGTPHTGKGIRHLLSLFSQIDISCHLVLGTLLGMEWEGRLKDPSGLPQQLAEFVPSDALGLLLNISSVCHTATPHPQNHHDLELHVFIIPSLGFCSSLPGGLFILPTVTQI